MYKSHAQAEIFDPRVELKRAKHNIESYLKRRAKAAWVSHFRFLIVSPPRGFSF